MTTNPTTAPAPQRLLVDAAEAAKMLAISRTTWYALLSAGRAPPGCRLGRCRRWSVLELGAWSAAGAPPLSRWTWKDGAP